MPIIRKHFHSITTHFELLSVVCCQLTRQSALGSAVYVVTLWRGYSPHSSTALDRGCYLLPAKAHACTILVQWTELWVQLQTRL